MTRTFVSSGLVLLASLSAVQAQTALSDTEITFTANNPPFCNLTPSFDRVAVNFETTATGTSVSSEGPATITVDCNSDFDLEIESDYRLRAREDSSPGSPTVKASGDYENQIEGVILASGPGVDGVSGPVIGGQVSIDIDINHDASKGLVAGFYHDFIGIVLFSR